MPIRVFKEDAAASAVGTNIAGNKAGRQLSAGQAITKVALTGSAAAGDAAVKFRNPDGVEIATVYNTSTGNFPKPDTDWITLDDPYIAEKNEEIIVEIVDAGVTNVLYAFAEISG